MTEAEWLECTDPAAVPDFPNGKASDRKLRLFACACCRRVWSELPEKWTRMVIETAERFADGECSTLTLGQAEIVGAEYVRSLEPRGSELLILAALESASPNAGHAARRVARLTSSAFVFWRELEKEQSYLVKEILGNPFRPVSSNLAWLNSTATSLAASAYEDRITPSGELDPDRLAVLSDALKEAGCDDADILDHLRGPGPHVRGCWALDLILGKT